MVVIEADGARRLLLCILFLNFLTLLFLTHDARVLQLLITCFVVPLVESAIATH